MPALAADSKLREPIVVSGPGARTCQEFNDAYRENKARAEAMYFSWAQGYWSFANVAHMMRNEKIKDLGWSLPAQQSRMRTYCSMHPLNPYWQAATDVYVTNSWTRPPRCPVGAQRESAEAR